MINWHSSGSTGKERIGGFVRESAVWQWITWLRLVRRRRRRGRELAADRTREAAPRAPGSRRLLEGAHRRARRDQAGDDRGLGARTGREAAHPRRAPPRPLLADLG